jgi:hypothetical protein
MLVDEYPTEVGLSSVVIIGGEKSKCTGCIVAKF